MRMRVRVAREERDAGGLDLRVGGRVEERSLGFLFFFEVIAGGFTMERT